MNKINDFMNKVLALPKDLQNMLFKKIWLGVAFAILTVIINVMNGINKDIILFGLLILVFMVGATIYTAYTICKEGYYYISGECLDCEKNYSLNPNNKSQKILLHCDDEAYCFTDARGKIKPGNIISAYIPTKGAWIEKDGARVVTRFYVLKIDKALVKRSES